MKEGAIHWETGGRNENAAWKRSRARSRGDQVVSHPYTPTMQIKRLRTPVNALRGVLMLPKGVRRPFS